MPNAEPSQRIRRALDELVRAVPNTRLSPPASAGEVEQLAEEAGPLAPEMLEYFSCCDGVITPDGSRLYSVADMLGIDTPGFFSISDDSCGNYDLITACFNFGNGSVVFWDHEAGETSYLVASSLSAYIELWTMRSVPLALGKEDPTRGIWPFDPTFMSEHDPASVALLSSASYQDQFGTVELRHVDRTGSEVPKERRGVNPTTGEIMVFVPPARPRCRQKYFRS